MRTVVIEIHSAADSHADRPIRAECEVPATPKARPAKVMLVAPDWGRFVETMLEALSEKPSIVNIFVRVPITMADWINRGEDEIG